MEFVDGNLARTANRHRKRRGPIWHDRYDAPVLSDEAEIQLALLGYVLAHGAKEGVVTLPEDWPGVNSARELNARESRRLKGVWRDRTRICRTTTAYYEANRDAFEEVVYIEHTPLASLSDTSRAEELDTLQQATDASIDAGLRKRGLPLRAHPYIRRAPVLKHWTHDAPLPVDAPPHERFRASSDDLVRAMRDAYADICEAYREAAVAHKYGDPFRYPDHTHPRRLRCAWDPALDMYGERAIGRQTYAVGPYKAPTESRRMS